MNSNNPTECCPESSERKEVIVIGNGPSAIALSYILSGHIPYWNGCPVSNDYLNIKLEQYVKDSSLLEQDLEFLSDGLEGRSRNPVALLIDNLMHPDADLGANLQSKLKWRHDPSLTIDHLCIGRGGIGGVWNRLASKQLQTVSRANWMELPNYPMSTFRQQRRACRCKRNAETLNDDQAVRATYDEVRSYYIHYVKRNHLANFFRNGCEVTSIERVFLDAPFIDDITEEIRTPEPLWEIRGYYEQSKQPFTLHAKYVVLATGMPQNVTRPLGFLGEQATQSFTYTSLQDIEELILSKKRLTKNSKPLLVVGCGLTAIDVLLICQQYSIPVIHVFRRATDDYELALNQLTANIYPEYELIRELTRQAPTTSNNSSASASTSSQWSYHCYPQSEVVSITEDGTAHIRNLRTQQTIDYDISFVARLTGCDVTIPFLSSSLTAKKKNGLHVNPYTYECIDIENVYTLGPLAGDKLVRFLQGGALACAASLLKKHRQASASNNSSSSRLALSVTPRVRVVA